MSKKEAFLKWPSMIVWLVGITMTAYGAPELMTTTFAFCLAAVGLALLLNLMWQKRTRPRRNGFWVLVHIILLAGIVVLTDVRPLVTALATLPMAMLWIHNSPASPTAMLGWGILLVLWQPAYWASAPEEAAPTIALTVVVLVAAAQMERTRLAAKQFAQPSPLWSMVRLAVVAAVSLALVQMRDSLRVVNVFTAMGLDLSGVAGKITMLGITALSLAVALAVFRTRPDKPKPTEVTSAPSQPGQQRRIDPKAGSLDFDDTTRKVDEVVQTRQERAMAQRKPKAATAASKKAAQPGELDFD